MHLGSEWKLKILLKTTTNETKISAKIIQGVSKHPLKAILMDYWDAYWVTWVPLPNIQYLV